MEKILRSLSVLVASRVSEKNSLPPHVHIHSSVVFVPIIILGSLGQKPWAST